MMTVYDLKIGQKGTIHNIDGDERLAKRLLALGCINNTEIEILHCIESAPVLYY